MARVKPFRALRPTREAACRVAALPYDVYSREEAGKAASGNPDSFLHVDCAEIDLPESIAAYDMRVYQKARENLDSMEARGVYQKDERPMLYIYRLTWRGRSQTGVVGLTALDEYLDGTIKKHELTRADKEQDRLNHVNFLKAQTGPIFMAYRGVSAISERVLAWADGHPEAYDFTAEDGVRHQVWAVTDEAYGEEIAALFQQAPHFYIADGHHRMAAAVRIGQMEREKRPDYTGEEEFNYILSVLFPAEELQILPYNRVVRDLNGLSQEAFLEALSERFLVSEAGAAVRIPENKNQIGMYLDGKWRLLCAKDAILTDDPVESLSVAMLQKYVLEPVLGIGDIRKDRRIDFVGGIRGAEELVCLVDKKEAAVAFYMYPTALSELMAAADAGLLMPPKSTWFEPKLRSGLFVHKILE